MAVGGNNGGAGGAKNIAKAQSRPKKLKKVPTPAPTPTQIKSAKAQEQAYSSGPKKIPVRPGAKTNRYSSKPTTQAQRSHVHNERVKRNKQLAPEKAYASQGQAVERAANEQRSNAALTKGMTPEGKAYYKKHPELLSGDKEKLAKLGFSPDIGAQVSANAVKDIVEIGQTPASIYHLTEPTVKALATGHPEKAGKEALKAAKQVGEPYVEIAKHPLKSLKEHPILTPLTVAGPKALIGRGAGAVARTGALGKTIEKAAATEKVVKSVPGTSLTKTEKYSPDVITKARQVGVEKVKAAKARRQEALGGPEVQPVARMSEREIQKRVDERVALNEDVRRANRAKVIHEASQALKHNEHPATSLIAQGIVKPNRADIKQYISELEAEHANLRPAEKYANKHLRSELQKVADNPKISLEKAQEAGKKYAKIIETRQPALIEHGLLTEEQSLRARLIPYAVRYMGAKHENGALVTADGHPLSTEAILEHYKLHHLNENAILYHGSPRGPETIMKEGLRPSTPELASGVADRNGVFFSRSPRTARVYGPYMYAVDTHATQGLTKDMHGGPGALHTPHHIPASAIRYLGKAGNFDEKLVTQLEKETASRKSEVQLPAFVTHRPRRRGNFNIRSESAPNIGSGVRTGRSTKVGLLDTSHGALIENAARVQGLKDAAEGFNGIVKEFAVKTGDEPAQFSTRAQAIDAARNMRFDEHGNPLPGTHNMVPIRLSPFKKSQLEALIENTRGDEMVGTHSPIREAIQSALNGAEGEGPWGLIPEAAAKRIREHMNTMGSTTFEQAFQAGSGVFRKTVLSTSPTWLWGNVSEATIRSMLNRAGPGSYVHARRVLNDLHRTNPELAQEVAHRVAGGGHFSTAERMQIFRSADQFTDTGLEPVANAMAKVVRAPGANTVANAWHQYTTHVFRFNSFLERQFQTAMFGRALKREGYKAVEDAARGLKNTEAQVRFGRMVDDAYGKYSKWSPSTRRLIAGYTPFISWWLAAANFVFRVLPRDHPVATSLMAASVTATRDWREKEKITLPQLGMKAGFLAGDIPLSGGRHVNIARFTPFGAFTNPSDVANTVLPQYSAIANAARGQDWKGKEYKTLKEGVNGTLGEIAGAYVPFFSRFESAKKYGVTQSLNPYRPIAPGKKKPGRKRESAPAKIDLGGGSSGHKIPLDGSSGSHKIKLG